MLLSGELKAHEPCLIENQEARGNPGSCPSQMYELEKITQPVQASRALYAKSRCFLAKTPGMRPLPSRALAKHKVLC